MSYVYCEVPRKARKPHQCRECRGAIVPGEVYSYVSGVWDGRGDSWAMCSTCSEVKDAWYEFARAERLTPEDWEVGTMWEAIQFWIEERPALLAWREREEAARRRSWRSVA